MSNELSLPTERIGPEEENPSLFLLYSRSKVGKTTLVSKLENNCILDLENGTKYIDAIKLHINSLDELNAYGKEIASKRPYDYITIDPTTKLEEMVKPRAKEIYMSTPQGKNFNPDEDILSLPKGAGYKFLREAFDEYLNKLRKLAPYVILVGHLKTTSMDKEGKEVDVKDFDLTGKIKDMVAQECDAIGYLYRGDDSELNISFKSKEDITCGARPDHLKGQDLKIADYDPEANDLTDVRWDKVFK